MILLPNEQRALLRIEWSLRRDPGLAAALDAFGRRRFSGTAPAREGLSPWHPVLWRAVPVGLAACVLTLVALAVVLVVSAVGPARTSCGDLSAGCPSGAGRTAPVARSGPPKTRAKATHGLVTPPGGSPLHGIGATRGTARPRP